MWDFLHHMIQLLLIVYVSILIFSNILCAFQVYHDSITSNSFIGIKFVGIYQIHFKFITTPWLQIHFKFVINNQIRRNLSNSLVTLIFKKFIYLFYFIFLSILPFFSYFFISILYYSLNLTLSVILPQNSLITMAQLNCIHYSFQIYCQPSIYLLISCINFFFFSIIFLKKIIL